jgi:hypothetical protein
MPGLKDLKASFDSEVTPRAGDATQPPGFAKRRIWTSPELTTHAAAVLTPARLYLVPGISPPPADSVRAVEAGADPAEAFGSLVTIVNLGSVRSVTHDLLANTVHLDALAGSGMTGTWTSRATLAFAKAEAADALFTKLWRRLGDDYKLRPDRPPLSQTVQSPLAVLAGILIATALLVIAANAAADHGPAAPSWLAPFGTLSWQAIAVAGGIAAAVVQVGMYRRLTRPPQRLELVKS